MVTQRLQLKVVVLSLGMAGLVFLPFLAREVRSTTQPSAPKAKHSPNGKVGPKIEFATLVHDFGEVIAGEVVRFDFAFANTGDGVLEITQVIPTCGCTTAGDWKRNVKPGECGVIPIQLKTDHFDGPLMKTVTVVCNAAGRTNLSLQLAGSVWPAVEVNPVEASFGSLFDLAEAKSTSIKITSHFPKPIAISVAEISSKTFRAELKPIVTGQEFVLVVALVPPLTYGAHRGTIALKTSEPRLPSLSVTASALVQRPLMVYPAQILLPADTSAGSTKRFVNVRNYKRDKLVLSDVKISVEGVDLKVQETQPGTQFQFELTFPEGFQIPRDKKIALAMKTNHPEFPTLEVPITQAGGNPVTAMPKASAGRGPGNAQGSSNKVKNLKGLP